MQFIDGQTVEALIRQLRGEAAGTPPDESTTDEPPDPGAALADTRPEVHDPAAAATSWERTLAFLRRTCG